MHENAGPQTAAVGVDVQELTRKSLGQLARMVKFEAKRRRRDAAGAELVDPELVETGRRRSGERDVLSDHTVVHTVLVRVVVEHAVAWERTVSQRIVIRRN